jgi:hypothetical protein
MNALRHWWRCIRNRCVLCGGKRSTLHPAFVILRGTPRDICRPCSKRIGFALTYGGLKDARGT